MKRAIFVLVAIFSFGFACSSRAADHDEKSKALIQRALTVFEKAQGTDSEEREEYRTTMRELIREGKAIVPDLLPSLETANPGRRGGGNSSTPP